MLSARCALRLIVVLVATVPFGCSGGTGLDAPSDEEPSSERALTGAQILVPKGAVWKYLEVGTGGTAWRAPEFDDSAWKSGPALLGYGDPDIKTPMGNRPAPHITAYFRRSFTVAQPTEVRALLINLLKDDGAVVYLNGTEVARMNMAPGFIGVTTRALDSVEGIEESLYYSHTAPASLLVAGTNVLAVEVHQASSQSSDLRFDLELQGSSAIQPPPPIQDTLVSKGTFWRYLDAGADPGPGWENAQYDDATWLSRRAPLGYGDPDISTFVRFGNDPTRKAITTYFRGRFTVERPADVAGLLINMMSDDGAVVYLNGTELFRSNMPEGVVTRDTLATRSLSAPEEDAYYPFRPEAAASLLVPGNNLLAAEVHQGDPESSDLRFDLEVIASLAPRHDSAALPIHPP